MSRQSVAPVHFPIRFDGAYRLVSTLLLLPPSGAYVEVDGDEVHVRMSWAFRSVFSRRAVVSASEIQIRPLSRGVHGFRGRWLVNGSGRGIVSVELAPPQRAHVMGFPIRLRQLMVSVEDPAALAIALTASA
jgi:hypothetical protein